MKTVHCTYCSKEVEVNQRGLLKPHMSGDGQCIGSGFVAAQIAELSKLVAQNSPGVQLAKNFRKNYTKFSR